MWRLTHCAEFERPRRRAELCARSGIHIEIKEWWNFDVDYRFNRFTEARAANFLGRDTSGTYTGATTQQWRDSLNQLDLRMEFTPVPGLVISPGIRLMKRDALALADGTDQIRHAPHKNGLAHRERLLPALESVLGTR